MKESLLKLIDKLLVQGETQGETDTAAYKGLKELRDSMVENKPFDEFSLEALVALDALLIMIAKA